MRLRLATRASALALWQAETAAERLRAAGVSETELVHVRSSGDRDRTRSLAAFGRIGIFTVEVDRAVLEGRADVGVHSLKDMTTTLQGGVVLAGVLPRGPVEDVLVSRDDLSLADLPAGARAATGSLRRAASVRATRPDLRVVDARGNVATRIGKLERGEAEAVVLARAGLVRLGLEHCIAEVLDTERFLPAVGQGIVGLTSRADDEATAEAVRAVTDAATWPAALAERAFLRELRGGCNVPAGGHATARDGTLVLRGRVLSMDGTERIEGRREGPPEAAEGLGRNLARELLDEGAQRLIDAARG